MKIEDLKELWDSEDYVIYCFYKLIGGYRKCESRRHINETSVAVHNTHTHIAGAVLRGEDILVRNVDRRDRLVVDFFKTYNYINNYVLETDPQLKVISEHKSITKKEDVKTDVILPLCQAEKKDGSGLVEGFFVQGLHSYIISNDDFSYAVVNMSGEQMSTGCNLIDILTLKISFDNGETFRSIAEMQGILKIHEQMKG